jgi:hypothetical protein
MAVQSDGQHFIGETAKMMNGEQKCAGKIGIRACFEDRDDLFLAC